MLTGGGRTRSTCSRISITAGCLPRVYVDEAKRRHAKAITTNRLSSDFNVSAQCCAALSKRTDAYAFTLRVQWYRLRPLDAGAG
eukprot:SAG31_NODE_618_length_13513_cov_87.043164_2_plen_84_part_00